MDPETTPETARLRAGRAWPQELEDDLRARLGEREEAPSRSWAAWLTDREASRRIEREDPPAA